ncbi:hypothetical protein EJ05DRAFT_245531 [Pseudovirgaria hyperparasitica]|uniref:Uncharacterized protein n=1 Tax=Pseudovirgaria hyperparasitica TaxID=470096 RepID=A0A6A6WGW6_9PEZI|nr:uncharacterized protein EJ05DRAFT_245531 [Pseudovirgaria hyperparasitica]KAF2760887.1 hypothetical protein EJ05DRAFT_245531 [Pseudovirgaria hyperparasitica]
MRSEIASNPWNTSTKIVMASGNNEKPSEAIDCSHFLKTSQFTSIFTPHTLSCNFIKSTSSQYNISIYYAIHKPQGNFLSRSSHVKHHFGPHKHLYQHPHYHQRARHHYRPHYHTRQDIRHRHRDRCWIYTLLLWAHYVWRRPSNSQAIGALGARHRAQRSQALVSL